MMAQTAQVAAVIGKFVALNWGKSGHASDLVIGTTFFKKRTGGVTIIDPADGTTVLGTFGTSWWWLALVYVDDRFCICRTVPQQSGAPTFAVSDFVEVDQTGPSGGVNKALSS